MNPTRCRLEQLCTFEVISAQYWILQWWSMFYRSFLGIIFFYADESSSQLTDVSLAFY